MKGLWANKPVSGQYQRRRKAKRLPEGLESGKKWVYYLCVSTQPTTRFCPHWH